MLSCRKERDHDAKQVVVNTMLSSGAIYQLNLQPYGDSDDVAFISKQSAYFSVSEIIKTPGRFAPVYRYSSETKTGGNDQVVLEVGEGNNRCNAHRSTTITINFTIK